MRRLCVSLCVVLAMLVLAMAAPAVADDLPQYRAVVTSRMGKLKLSIDATIQKEVPAEALKTLAAKVCADNGGTGVERVFIMWYLPHYKIGSGAWATTNIVDGEMQVNILRLQDM